MKIYKPEIIENEENVKIQCYFEYLEGSDYLWYSLDKKYSKYLVTEKLDGFLLGLLILAMKKREDIYLDWPVSEKLYFNLTNYYIKILSTTAEELQPVKIIPSAFDKGDTYTCEKAVGTGFSGGVDSFCTIYERLFKEDIPESFKITHFVFNNVGSHGDFNMDRAQELFNERYEMLKSFPEGIGKDFIKIDSNLSDILKIKFEPTHTPRNLSVILLLQKLFNKFYYASAYCYTDCCIKFDSGCSASDPITLSLLSTETLDFIPEGSQYTRVEKTEIISDFELAQRYLNVCVNEGENCSVCFKCMRTILTLEILGKMEQFKKVFNFDKYYWAKCGYITSILKDSQNALGNEILELAKSKNFTLPLKSRLTALLPGSFISKYRKLQNLIRKYKNLKFKKV